MYFLAISLYIVLSCSFPHVSGMPQRNQEGCLKFGTKCGKDPYNCCYTMKCSDETHTCDYIKPEGQQCLEERWHCFPDQQWCCEGLYCNNTESACVQICKEEGQACQWHDDYCCEGFVCSPNIQRCMSCTPAGNTCEEEADLCCKGYACIGGVCTESNCKKTGKTCRWRDDECCEDNICDEETKRCTEVTTCSHDGVRCFRENDKCCEDLICHPDIKKCDSCYMDGDGEFCSQDYNRCCRGWECVIDPESERGKCHPIKPVVPDPECTAIGGTCAPADYNPNGDCCEGSTCDVKEQTCVEIRSTNPTFFSLLSINFFLN